MDNFLKKQLKEWTLKKITQEPQKKEFYENGYDEPRILYYF